MSKLIIKLDYVLVLRNFLENNELDVNVYANRCAQAGADGVSFTYSDYSSTTLAEINSLICGSGADLFFDVALNKADAALAKKLKNMNVCFGVGNKNSQVKNLPVKLKGNKKLEETLKLFKKQKINCGAFIDTEADEIRKAKAMGFDFVEFSTGKYTVCKNDKDQIEQLSAIGIAAELAKELGLKVMVTGFIDYENAQPLSLIGGIDYMTVGYSVTSMAVLQGLAPAIKIIKKSVL